MINNYEPMVIGGVLKINGIFDTFQENLIFFYQGCAKYFQLMTYIAFYFMPIYGVINVELILVLIMLCIY